MNQNMSKQADIRRVAMELDEAIERREIEVIATFFSDDCEIELLGVKLVGKDGLRKAVEWIYSHFKDIKLTPIVITVEDNVFFEEFIMSSKSSGNRVIELKQAEVLIYDDDLKVKRLSLYFDRLEMVESQGLNPFDRIVINRL
jgi:ketosteroid isomerase-like protein